MRERWRTIAEPVWFRFCRVRIGTDKTTGELQYPQDMAILDWSRCLAVESVPGRLGGAWVFRGTRMPVSAVFQNLEVGATADEIAEWFSVSKDEVNEVLEFAARSLAAPLAAEADPKKRAASIAPPA